LLSLNRLEVGSDEILNHLPQACNKISHRRILGQFDLHKQIKPAQQVHRPQ
jgi:hypothetical protein